MVIPVALVIGAIGGFGSFDLLQDDSLDETSTNSGMMGHVTAIARDASGQITGYSQGDNLILDGGEDCVAKLVFLGPANTAGIDTECAGATGPFNFIGLVNGTSCASEADATSQNPTNNCTLGGPDGLINSTTSGFQRVTPDSTVLADDAGETKVTLTELFTNAEGSNTILRSVLMNGTQTAAKDIILASQNFGTAATVSAGGTLTIIWEITTGSTGTFN